MCRLLYVNSKNKFDIKKHLLKFSLLCKSSKEYQGHGWGCAYLRNGEWKYYKNILPIWEDNLMQFGEATRLLVHARSAFQDKDIFVENNMPFYDDKYIFIFNGELRGVKINSEGRIGAEKIFNYIKRFDKGDMFAALKKSVEIIKKRTDYIRAMNIIILDEQQAYVASVFNENPEYFTMQKKETGENQIICSAAYPNDTDWEKIENNFIGVIK